jgi:hypothetical protein
MKVIESGGRPRFYAIGLGPDELLLESIKEAIGKYDIRNGAVLCGVGTLKRCRLHYVNTSAFPPENKFYTIEEPLEIVSISGLIADYEPHIHISAGCRDNRSWVGHLEDGSVVLYLAEMMVTKMDDLKMKRRTDERYKVSLLEKA